MSKKADDWQGKLDSIIEKGNSFDPICIRIEELPSAVGIVEKKGNIAPLKAKLEQLNYLLLIKKLNDDSRELLARFIDNCEREIAKAERKKRSNPIPIPGWRYIVLTAVALLWLGASAAPVICYYTLHHKSGFYFSPDKNQDGKIVAEQHHRVRQTNWVTIFSFSVSVIVYLSFYAGLTAILFSLIKSIHRDHRRQLIHNDLLPVAAILSKNIDPTDTTKQQLRNQLLKILIDDDTEE